MRRCVAVCCAALAVLAVPIGRGLAQGAGAPAAGTLTPTMPLDGTLRVAYPDGLVQIVRIDPHVPHPGERLHISVTLRNESRDTLRVKHYVCGLPLAGLTLAPLPGNARGTCGAAAISGLFSPGAAYREEETRILRSGPGAHDVTAGLLPGRLVRFRLVVQSRHAVG